ncbi:MAG TPA: Omp28-related outer membrane protein, partial [Bacteroidia bacterium]|nr:Omp28-related outer membrane protein [Bacteroidia bacterium]
DIIAGGAGKAVFMGTYGSSSSLFYNPAAAAFKNQFDASAGWPAFCVNGRNRTAYSSSGGIYTSTTKTNVLAAIDSTAAATAKVNTGFKMTYGTDSVRVSTRTKFFAEMSGDIYLGVYLIEDGALGVQTGLSGTVSHHHVLQGSFSQPFGTQIATGTTAANKEVLSSFALKTNAAWDKTKLKIATVIWKKNGSTYEFVNAYTE